MKKQPLEKNRIKEIRVYQHLSAKQLADIVGCTKGHISGAERGAWCLSDELKKRLAQALKVSVGHLFYFESREE